MGPISAIRAVAPSLGSTGHPNSGAIKEAAELKAAISEGSRASGGKIAFTQKNETSQAVDPAKGSHDSTSAQYQQDVYLLETARERAVSAHRAYEMTAIILGQNPLNKPIS